MTENSQDKVRATLVRALREVERLRLKVAALEGAASEPIAIVGIGLRLPGGVVDLASLWSLLERELDTVRPIPSSRWDADAVYSAERRPDKTYTREAALLDQVESFDPGFFNITPREARHIDPQHRLLLEASWEALEAADIVPATLAESQTGVFVGIGPSDYQQLLRGPQRDPYTTTGTHMSFAAGRVAFTLGLQGPAVSLDTACSSSLVALHLACQSLRAGECSLALAAGVQVLASPEAFIHLAQTQALAPDGRCKTFSANANGYGRGEGVVVLALQRLADAKAQARPVLALVRGSAVTHDGRSSGITAPNGSSQQKVLRAALAAAHVTATDVDVIECHGTGTSLGDPIEVRALATVYGANREPDRPLLLGTIKTNVGHLESAAGLAGVAKMIASMHAEQLPASLHSHPRNPHIDWDKLPVAIVDARRAWPRNPQRPRRAGVSGFGLSGTNCHVILEEPELPAKLEADRSEPPLPFVLSARSEPALRAQAEHLLEHAPTVDLAFSLATHRTHFERRVAFVPTPEQPLAAALRSFISEPASVGVAPAQSTLAVLFTGQGAQYLGMGGTLERCEPAYRDAFAQVCEQLDRHLEIPLREVMYAAPDSARHGLIDQTQYTQAALFALEVALYRLYESWGVRPALLLGHSIGELTAAHVSGVLSLEDACRLVAARGRLMQALPPGGAMLSLQASEREVNAAIAEVAAVEIAGLNGPMSTVVSGPTEAIDAIAAHFTRLGRKARRLSVSHAFHSSLMQPMLDEFRAIASSLQFHPAQIPIVSNVSGNIASAAELSSPEYWARHVRQAVRFLDGVRTLEAKGTTVMLEIGPHGVLASMAAGCLSELGQQRVTIVPSLRRDRSDDLAIAQALGQLHCAGVPIDWNAHFARHSPTRVDLPFYPFQRERHWVEQRPAAVEAAAVGRYALSGQRVEVPTGVIHRIAVGPRLQSYLGDHRVYGVLVVPGAFHVAVALAIGESHWPDRAIELRNVEFVRALTFESDDVVLDLHVELTPSSPGADEWDVKLMTKQGDRWVTHANMSMRPIDTPAVGPQLNVADLALEDRTPEHRQGLEEREIVWGPKWWWLDGVEQRASDRATGRLTAKDGTPDDDAPIPGGYLDNSFSLLSFAFHETDPSDRTPRLPFSLERLVWFGQRTAPRFSSVLADRERSTADTVVADISIYDPSGRPLAEIERFVVRRAPADRFLPSSSTQHVWRIAWVAADATAQPLTSWRGLGTNTLDLASWDAVPDLEHLVELATQPQASIRTVVAALVFPEADAQEYATRALRLLQAWLAEPRLAELELVIATRRALGCAPDERCDVAASAVWGLTRSARAEAPNQRIRLIDIDDAPDSRTQWERALAIDSSELAIRRGRILAPRLEPAPAPASAGFDGNGTCLITGATGSLGRLLTLHLVRQHGAKNLLLLSRAGSSAASASALAAECTDAGAKVILQTCDVADRASLQAALASIPSSAPLTAVFHLAGVVDDAVLSKLDEAAIARVFRPKVLGALNLHELAPPTVQTFVLFSSLSGTLGSAGQANYAAANAVLDALAHDRRAQGLPALSLAWGPWGQVGMAASLSEGDRARLERQGVNLFDNDQALAAFDLALRQADPVLVPVSLDKQKLAERSGPLSPMLAHLIAGRRRPASEPGSNAILDQLKSSSSSERLTILRELVRTETAAILGLGDPRAVDPDRLLQELGLDSLVAVELRNQLQRKAGVRLSATLTFDYPTINAIAGFLDNQLTPKLAGERRPAPTRASVTTTGREIAIVGMACRLPGGIASPEDLWQLLADGRDAIGEFPTDRGWPQDLYNPDPDARGKSAASGGGFLYDAAEFDHTFFGIGTQEAVHIDPQHRLLLETSWEAFERAGIRPHSLRESLTGVYLGIMYNEYGTLAGSLDNYNGQVATGSASSVASGRIAYTLGLQGPAVTVDTACSSSLVSLHMACQALREHECDLAIAGGASVMSTPMTFVEFSRLLGMAPDGRCKPFSDHADGVGWGEGVGLLVLERLADAQKNGRNILAVIKGSALNHDGRSQGLTAPNGPAQQRVIQAALSAAKLDFDDIDAIEAHGTGTTLGDPIEAEAIANTYGRARRPDHPLWVGSIKSNLGHTQASAGVASVIKIVLAMQHRQLPRTLHAEALSRHIDWSETPVRLLDAPVEWSTSERPRRAAISSFGISGTNAHVILEEHSADAAAKSHEPDARAPHIPLLLSGKSALAVQAQARKLRAALNDPTNLNLVDVAHTLANHRTHFEWRAAVISHDLEGARTSLHAIAEGRPSPNVVPIARAQRGHLAYLFTGQGSQLPGMGRELASSYPEFADALRQAFDLINPLLGRPLDEIVFAESSEASALIHQTGFAQPALFALEVALFRLLDRWGLRPRHLLGHSIGEIAAAHVAGVFSLEDACKLVVGRGRLMQALPTGGAMYSLQANEDEVTSALRRFDSAKLGIAGLNGPNSTVISGEASAAGELASHFQQLGRKTHRLSVSHAFHSPLMDPMLDEFAALVGSLRLSPPTIPIISNLTGRVAGPELCQPDYWVRHVREPVRFLQGIQTLEALGATHFLELGPHGVLVAMASDCLTQDSLDSRVLVPCLRRDQPETRSLAAALASLHTRDADLELAWTDYFARLNGQQVDLPTYAFQRQRFWIGDGRSAVERVSDEGPRVSADAERFLALPSRVEQRALLAAIVEQETKAALTLADDFDFGRGFSDLGIDSLTAVQLRNALQDRLGLKIPINAFFEHFTIDAFVDATLAAAPAPQPRPEPTEPRDASEPADGGSMAQFIHMARSQADAPRPSAASSPWVLVPMLARLLEAQDLDAAFGLIESLAAARKPQPGETQLARPAPLRLAKRSSDSPAAALYCIPSLAAPSSPMQFARLAKHVDGAFSLWGGFNLGYAPDDALPESMGPTLEHHVAAAASCAEGQPYALLGYSAGSWVAMDVAARAIQSPTPPAALILLDPVYPNAMGREGSRKSQAAFIRQTLDFQLRYRSDESEASIVSEITAMRHYFEQYETRWTPPRLRIPTLYVHATRGSVDEHGQPVLTTDPKQHWGELFEHFTVHDLDCDHFDLVNSEEHTRQVIEAIRGWWSRVQPA